MVRQDVPKLARRNQFKGRHHPEPRKSEGRRFDPVPGHPKIPATTECAADHSFCGVTWPSDSTVLSRPSRPWGMWLGCAGVVFVGLALVWAGKTWVSPGRFQVVMGEIPPSGVDVGVGDYTNL